jgi:sodium-dependent dicarboxylate transporter 2/3/5
MMPVATPPNAIIFASEKLTVVQMAKAGFLLNLIAITVIIFITWTLVG